MAKFKNEGTPAYFKSLENQHSESRRKKDTKVVKAKAFAKANPEKAIELLIKAALAAKSGAPIRKSNDPDRHYKWIRSFIHDKKVLTIEDMKVIAEVSLKDLIKIAMTW